MEQKIEFRLEMGREELEAERAIADKNEAYEIQDIESLADMGTPGLAEARFVDPVTAAAVVTVAMLTTRLVDHWLRGREQGVQIDLRQKPPVISRLAGVPLGFLVVINKDGTATTHQTDYANSSEMIPLLQTIFKELPA